MARVLGRHCFLYCVFLLFSLLIYRTCNVLPSSTFHGSVNRQSPKASTYPNVDQILQKQKSEQDEAPARISGASVKANNIFGVPPVKRTISDKDWEDAVRNGARLVDLTKARTKEAAQVLLDEMKRDPPLKIESQFMSYDDLVANGWAYYPLEETGYEEYVDEGLKPVLEAIGATKENLGDSVIWIQPGKTPRWPHAGTNALYQNNFDVVEGIIIAPNNHSPEEEVKRHKYAPGWDGQHWPNLRRWSDVVFLEWKHQADHYHKSPKSLRYVLRNNIVNEKAQEIAERAVGPDGPKEWDDAEEISTESDEGKALLYSPNARGVAWLLAQHKEVLGLKTIRGIKVFSDVEGCWATWHMLLIIVPV